MFKPTEENISRFKEIINENRQIITKDFWKEITPILNGIYTMECSPENWRKRYNYWTSDRTKRITQVERNQMAYKESDKSKQLREMLRNRKTIDKLIGVLELPKYEILGMIQELQQNGYHIDYDNVSKTYGYVKSVVEQKKEYHHSFGQVKKIKFLTFSDSHLCCKDQQISFINYLYDECERREVDTVYHVGDLVDGYYSNRPEQIFNLFKLGADEQTEYVVNNFPKKEGITTYIIGGNHDETFIKSNGYNIVKTVCAMRDDMVYLGLGYARVFLTPNCKMDLFHPLDGSSYALSYSTQKYIDSITGGDKPNILLVGHHHKALAFPYRNIMAFEVPATCKLTSWQRRVRQMNVVGAYFIEVDIDEEGTVVAIKSEFIPQFKQLENDY